MARPDFDRDASTSHVAKLAKRIVYGIVVFDAVLFVAYSIEFVPSLAFGILYWGSGLAMLGLIHKVESAAHPEQRWWWTLLPAAIGGFGLLSWLRHLDRDH